MGRPRPPRLAQTHEPARASDQARLRSRCSPQAAPRGDPSTPIQTTPGSGRGRVPAAEDRTDCRRFPDTAGPDPPQSPRPPASPPDRDRAAPTRPGRRSVCARHRRLPPTATGDRSGPDRRRKHHGRVRRAPEQMADELHRRIVAPLQIIEREQQWPRRRQTLEQLPRRKVSPEPLCRGPEDCARRAHRTECWKHRSQLPELLRGNAVKRACVKRGQVTVKRIDEQPKREVALQLGRPALQHQTTNRLGVARQLRDQRALADTRLATHDHEPRRAGTRLAKQALQYL